MDIFFWESLLLFPVLLVDGEIVLGCIDAARTRLSRLVGLDAVGVSDDGTEAPELQPS